MYAGVNDKFRTGNNPIAIDRYGVYHSVFAYKASNDVYYTYSNDEGYTWSTPLKIYTVIAEGMTICDTSNFSVISTPTHIHALGAIYKPDNSGYVYSFRAITGGEWTSTVMYAHSNQEHDMYNRLFTNETYGIRMPFWRHNMGTSMNTWWGIIRRRKKISSILKLRLYRDDNAYTGGGILVDQFDIHIEVDSFGSENEYLKW